jgi:hypothetical protein
MTIPEEVDPPVPVDPDPPPTDPGADDDGNGTREGTDGYITCTSGTLSYVSTNVGAKTTYYHVENSSFGGNTADPRHTIRKRHKWYRDGVVQTPTKNNGTTTATSGTFDTDSNGQTDYLCVCDDNTYSWRARVRDETDSGKDVNGTLYYWKTASIAATASTPVLPTVGAGTLEPTQAYIQCYFYPNTLHSTATAQLQWRISGGSWANLGSSAGTSGYSQTSIGRQLTGLSPETSYEVRLVITRNSVQNTTLTSATRTFSTPAGTPVVTTSAATLVSSGAPFPSENDGTARLNGNFDRNSQTDLQWRFGYDTSPKAGGAYSNNTAWTNSTSEPQTVLSNISSLTESDTYYFRLEVRYNSGTQFVYGSELSFTVPANPGDGADEEDFMLPIFIDAQVGVDQDIYFTLRQKSATNNDQLYDSTAPTAAQTKVYQNGASGANAVNAPSKVTTKLYKWTLDATEATTDIIDAVISSGGASFRDLHIQIRTKQKLSQVELDASNMSGDKSAFKATGNAAGHGIEAIGGATGEDISGILGSHVMASGDVTSGSGTGPIQLTNGYKATTDIYNGDTIMFFDSAGAVQSRTISAFTSGGAVTLATALISAVSGTYIIVPGARALDEVQAEITDVPTDASTIKEKIQFLVQRFQFRIVQSATSQTWYDSTGENVFGQRSVTDDGAEQDLAKLENP